MQGSVKTSRIFRMAADAGPSRIQSTWGIRVLHLPLRLLTFHPSRL